MIQEKDRIIEFSVVFKYFGVASVSYIVYIIFVSLKYWIITSKFEGIYNAGVF